MIKLELQGLSQVGMVRTNNEDMLSLGGILLRDDELEFPIELDEESQFHLLVSDGMGGHEYGERASQGLLEYLCECFKENRFRPESIEDDLRFHVKAFSDQLNQQAAKEGQLKPMGCTLTGVVWSQGKVYLLNAGDSRTYRFRNGILRQLTQDETVRAITGNPDDSKGLVNCIGAGSEGNLVVEDLTDRLSDGDQLLICSDGLTDMVPDEDIEKVLAESEESADDLYTMACRNGGEDNISIIVARIIFK
jgi:protein phosphatase